MAMESIREEGDEAKSSFWNCCSTGATNSKSNNESERAPPTPASMDRSMIGSGRPTLSKRGQQSVYLSAREILGETELKALKEFEDAARASIRAGGDDESLYFDALELEDDNTIAALPYAPARVADPRPRESVSMSDPSSLLAGASFLKELKDPRVKVECAGYPGNLTEQELAAVQKFRAELQRRKQDTGGKTYEDVVLIYSPVETEPYALCRFLRARQFQVDKVFDMVTEILDVWRAAQQYDYFPDPNEALGCPVNVFLTQLPTLYSGCAKNGAPVAYAFAADLSVEGIECLTELERIEKYAWYVILHKFKQQIARAQEMNPDVVRCEAIQIVDLKGLNASVLNKRTLDVLAKLIVVNKCFPEVLNSMVILNAPRFFTFFWRVIKAMLDPRTASKVVMFSNEQDGINWMLERIDKSELISDYGGDGDSFDAVLNQQNVGSGAKRQVVKRFAITQRTNEQVVDFELHGNEMAKFKAYTRSTAGADFELCQDGTTVTTAAVPASPDQKPFSVDLFTEVKGPGKFSIKSKGKATSTDYFVVAGEVF